MAQKLKGVGITIANNTSVSDKGRQAEVEYYIRRNDIKDYIVIDDDTSLFEKPQSINLYVPDYRKGLTPEDVRAILKMIKKLRK